MYLKITGVFKENKRQNREILTIFR
jgi:hypothetical protein